MQNSELNADKHLTMKSLLLVLLFCYSLPVYSQSLLVQSHYPGSAFVMNRLLPFTIIGDGVRQVTNVLLTSGTNSCSSMVDPSHKTTFFIFCFEPSLVDADIKIESMDGEEQNLTINSLIIFREREPGQILAPNYREPGVDI